MLKKIFISIMSVGIVLTAAGCTAAKDTKSNAGKINVVASINSVRDFAQKVGGDKVNVTLLVPEGTEPHDFDPKPKDLEKLANADLFVYSGAGMEDWIDSVKSAVGSSEKLTILDASKNVDLIKSDGKTDPHIWLSLKEAKNQSKSILDELIKLDSKDKDYFEQNYNNFAKDLDDLYNSNKSRFASLANKDFVTGHEAFGYLCRDFGLTQKSVEDMFAEGEPTPKKLANLVTFCKENKIKVIFMETLASPKVSETLANSVNAKVEKIYTLESKEDGLDYVQAMKKNLDNIYDSLKK